MEVDASAVYLVDTNDDHLVLMETEGLERAAIGKVRLAPGEGVTGLVKERRGPVVLDNASKHPRFRHFPLTGETRYRAFLGVPVIHFGKVIGVLAVYREGFQEFTPEHETFLVTASAQLAGALAVTIAQSSSWEDINIKPRHKPFFTGVAGAPGVAIGVVVTPSPFADLESVPDRNTSKPSAEESAFREAVTRVQADLHESGERMKDLLPSEAHALFEFYTLLVGDESLAEKVIEKIQGGQWAPAALRDAIRELVVIFEDIQDERLRARTEDIRAIGRRLLLELQADARTPLEFPKRTVLIGDEVSLARIADVPHDQLAGIICLKGSLLSHTAVVARALGIPAVMGLEDIPIEQLSGNTIVVDGYLGRVFIDPPATVITEFTRLEREEQELTTELEDLQNLPAETSDGVKVPLFVNTGLLTDINPSLKVNPAGVGLYRSEFPFMLRETFPTETQQIETYRPILEAFAPRPVVMRTLDIGGDKPLSYFPIEDANSLLGWRGIRVTLDHPEIFLTQLKAMLQANLGLGNLEILLPMISVPAEVHEARMLLKQAIGDLSKEGVNTQTPPLGVMIEVPVAIFELDSLAEAADFFSIGTNDLTQYLMAVDRDNPRVASLHDHLDPAVLRAIQQVVTQSRALGKPVSLCGELGGDPVGVVLLLGMGVSYLSVAAPALQRVKWVIRSFSQHQAADLLEQSLELPNAQAVRQLVHGALEKAGLDRIVHTTH